jgi:hypothetical protein
MLIPSRGEEGATAPIGWGRIHPEGQSPFGAVCKADPLPRLLRPSVAGASCNVVACVGWHIFLSCCWR